MAQKELLNIYFATETGTLIEYNLSSNAPDSVAIDFPIPSTWHKSSEGEELNQVGCGFLTPSSTATAARYWKQEQLNKGLKRRHYGQPVNSFIPAITAVGAKLYLFGKSVDEDNNPMPYVSYVREGDYVELHYYMADDDNTDLGPLYSMYVGTMGGAQLAWFAGKLYEDGTFVGSAGPIRPDEIIPGVYSGKHYEWLCTAQYDTPIQLIKPEIISDIMQYMPVRPEGEWSPPGGGTGDFDASSDDIDFPELPSLDVISTGLCAIYKMTAAQLQGFSNFLWSNLFDLDTYKKLFNDPMESIINLSIMPVDATTTGSATNIRIGNITSSASGLKVSAQYKTFDFGSINLNEYWASFADYSPYTKLSIFLPYVGVQLLSIDDVMNGTVKLKAHVDLLTGAVQYCLKSTQGNHRGHGHNSVLYTWGGNCQYQIPLSASNMTQVINSIVGATGSVAAGVGLAAATGGMTAPLAIGMAGSTISNVMNAKTHTQRGGGLGGAVGIFGIQTPYLILERPEQVYPQTYDQLVGQPAETAGYLSDYTGFVKVKACYPQISGATDVENEMIINLLKEGVLV